MGRRNEGVSEDNMRGYIQKKKGQSSRRKAGLARSDNEPTFMVLLASSCTVPSPAILRCGSVWTVSDKSCSSLLPRLIMLIGGQLSGQPQGQRVRELGARARDCQLRPRKNARTW